MKIGLDTNLLVRLITDDDPDQADLVESLFESLGKKDFLKAIDQLFKTENIAFNTPDLVKQAYKLYSKNNADFSDCYLSAQNNSLGCKTTYTFDKKASKLNTFTLLK